MKCKSLSIAALVIIFLLSVTSAHAQFHTVTTTSPSKQALSPKRQPQAGTPVKKRQEQTSRTVSAAFPLSHIEVTSPYGTRRDPFTKKKVRHNGLDLKACYEPAFAMLPGEVIRTGGDSRSGRYVTLRHGSLTVSYCHLSTIVVRPGMSVRPGTVIGLTGNTGRSTGPHLHLTLKKDGQVINQSVLLNIIRGTVCPR